MTDAEPLLYSSHHIRASSNVSSASSDDSEDSREYLLFHVTPVDCSHKHATLRSTFTRFRFSAPVDPSIRTHTVLLIIQLKPPSASFNPGMTLSITGRCNVLILSAVSMCGFVAVCLHGLSSIARTARKYPNSRSPALLPSVVNVRCGVSANNVAPSPWSTPNKPTPDTHPLPSSFLHLPLLYICFHSTLLCYLIPSIILL